MIRTRLTENGSKCRRIQINLDEFSPSGANMENLLMKTGVKSGDFPNQTNLHWIPGMSNLASKLGQIDPKWGKKSGTF